MKIFRLGSVCVSRRRLKKIKENRIDISAGSGYGPTALTPAEAIKLAKAIVKMAKVKS